MSDGAVILVTAIAAIVVVTVFLFALRRPLQRRWFGGTGFEGWRDVASQLPWSDRFRLERANSRGRAASPRLAALAVERGRTMVAMVEATGHRMQRFYRVLAVVGVLLVIGYAILIVVGEGSPVMWFNLVIWVGLTVLYGAMPRLQQRQRRRLQRSVELNEALVERRPDARP